MKRKKVLRNCLSFAVRTALVFGFVLLLFAISYVAEHASNAQVLSGLLILVGWCSWMFIKEGEK